MPSTVSDASYWILRRDNSRLRTGFNPCLTRERASVRASLASAKVNTPLSRRFLACSDVSPAGDTPYSPIVNVLSLRLPSLSNSNLYRQDLTPLGFTSKYNPFSSVSLYGLSLGFALRQCVSFIMDTPGKS